MQRPALLKSLSLSADADWEAFAADDPFWAVLTNEDYRAASSDPERLDRFLSTGRNHVARLWRTIEARRGGSFRPPTALDFGCGVGRITLALGERCESVLGVDVSPSMLSAAEGLRDERRFGNVEYLRSDDSLTGIDGPFDLIHSFIVFQHIPVRRGLRIAERLFGLLAPGGVCALHFTVSSSHPILHSQLLAPLRATYQKLRRVVLRRPRMQMNPYPIDAVLRRAYAAGLASGAVEITRHGDCLGLFLILTNQRTGEGRDGLPPLGTGRT